MRISRVIFSPFGCRKAAGREFCFGGNLKERVDKGKWYDTMEEKEVFI